MQPDIIGVSSLDSPPPSWLAELPLIVQLTMVIVVPSDSLTRPPPWTAELSLIVQSVRLAVEPKSLKTPPPSPAELPLTVQSVKSSAPSLNTPPP